MLNIGIKSCKQYYMMTDRLGHCYYSINCYLFIIVVLFYFVVMTHLWKYVQQVGTLDQ